MTTNIAVATNPKVITWNIKLMITTFRTFLAATFFLGLAVAFQAAWAGPGHDHGDAPAAAAGTASPRVSAQSDLFELVGIVDGSELKIYLDRFATNEPINDAKIEVDIGGKKSIAAAQTDGSYIVKNDVFSKPAELAISSTVLAGKDADLLAGDLTIPPPNDGHAHDHTVKPWLHWAAYGAGGLLAVIICGFILKRILTVRQVLLSGVKNKTE